MKPSEIITQNLKAIGKNPAPVLQWVSRLVKSKKGILLQHGDSVLLLNNIAPHVAELHLFTVDKPMALMGAIKDFIAKLRKSEIKRVYGKADNEQIVRAVSAAGLPTQKSDRPEYNWMADMEV